MVIHLDYATFNFDLGTMTPDEVGHALLGDENCNLHWVKNDLSDNALLRSPFGISWLPNSGYAPRPHRLQVSGFGCDNFFYTLPNLVSSCNARNGDCSFSRLDFAFDVIIEETEWKKFISKAFESSLNSERQLKKYTLSGTGLAMTIYIGSRTSPRFFRIYNKTLQDKQYIYHDDSGCEVKVPDGFCVIRYEVELKRKLWNRDGKKVVIDPSPLFYDYYSGEQSLVDYIRSLWLSFGDDILLPYDFENAPLSLLSKNKNFVQISQRNAVELTEEKVYKAPYSFDHVVNYVVEKFGQYIPFIIADKMLFDICQDKASIRIGFVPDYNLDNFLHTGTYEIDDSDDSLPWEDEILPYYESFRIENYEEGG